MDSLHSIVHGCGRASHVKETLFGIILQSDGDNDVLTGQGDLDTP